MINGETKLRRKEKQNTLRTRALTSKCEKNAPKKNKNTNFYNMPIPKKVNIVLIKMLIVLQEKIVVSVGRV